MSKKKPRKPPAREAVVTVRNFYRDFDIQVCRVRPSGHVFLDIREGDLVVRKFYRPKVLKVAFVAADNKRVYMTDEDGEQLWETAAELLNPKLYSIHAVPDVARAAAAVARVAAARQVLA
jgi:hypothetical protein